MAAGLIGLFPGLGPTQGGDGGVVLFRSPDPPVLLHEVGEEDDGRDLVAVSAARVDGIPGTASEVKVDVRLPTGTVKQHRAIGAPFVLQAPSGLTLVIAKAQLARLLVPRSFRARGVHRQDGLPLE